MTPVTVGIVMTSEAIVGAVGGTVVVTEPLNRATTASGSGSDGLVPDVPYRNTSSAASESESTLVLSMTRIDVGSRPLTETGVVVKSHENSMPAGESLMVA